MSLPLLIAVAAVEAQSWRQAMPQQRTLLAVTFDIARARTVMFGGTDAYNRLLGDTWHHDGVTWSQVIPSVAPSARVGHAMAYDVVRGRSVLFGGLDRVAILADTWEHDGTNWSRATPAVAPPPRLGHALAYDLARGRTVLFGGVDSGASLADTWEYDGTTWSRAQLPVAPRPRSGHAMAYDVFRGSTTASTGPGPSSLSRRRLVRATHWLSTWSAVVPCCSVDPVVDLVDCSPTPGSTTARTGR
jgi:hypothetical protein